MKPEQSDGKSIRQGGGDSHAASSGLHHEYLNTMYKAANAFTQSRFNSSPVEIAQHGLASAEQLLGDAAGWARNAVMADKMSGAAKEVKTGEPFRCHGFEFPTPPLQHEPRKPDQTKKGDDSSKSNENVKNNGHKTDLSKETPPWLQDTWPVRDREQADKFKGELKLKDLKDQDPYQRREF